MAFVLNICEILNPRLLEEATGWGAGRGLSSWYSIGLRNKAPGLLAPSEKRPRVTSAPWHVEQLWQPSPLLPSPPLLPPPLPSPPLPSPPLPSPPLPSPPPYSSCHGVLRAFRRQQLQASTSTRSVRVRIRQLSRSKGRL